MHQYGFFILCILIVTIVHDSLLPQIPDAGKNRGDPNPDDPLAVCILSSEVLSMEGGNALSAPKQHKRLGPVDNTGIIIASAR